VAERMNTSMSVSATTPAMAGTRLAGATGVAGKLSGLISSRT
jgi:hypothetical protein